MNSSSLWALLAVRTRPCSLDERVRQQDFPDERGDRVYCQPPGHGHEHAAREPLDKIREIIAGMNP